MVAILQESEITANSCLYCIAMKTCGSKKTLLALYFFTNSRILALCWISLQINEQWANMTSPPQDSPWLVAATNPSNMDDRLEILDVLYLRYWMKNSNPKNWVLSVRFAFKMPNVDQKWRILEPKILHTTIYFELIYCYVVTANNPLVWSFLLSFCK